MSDLTYGKLAKATAALAQDIARSAEAIHGHATTIWTEADDTARLAEAIAALHVDSATVAETRDLASVMRGLGESASQYAAAAERTSESAQAAHHQNQASHSRIGEAAARSSVGRDIYDVDRTWLAPE
ncbi:hypothetical protein [Streptomyces sp. PU_AKi4]|uniref:hypothetical protein n=1 Tax=Streptomyces sp. PU_AKi4 TaxID=2800809 RepID=UPI0035259B21